MKHRLRSLYAVGAAAGLAAVAIAAGGPAASAGSAPTVAKAAKARPQQLFYDDFSGSALDRTKWNVVVQTRTNQMRRALKSVETLPEDEAQALLPPAAEGDEPAAAGGIDAVLPLHEVRILESVGGADHRHGAPTGTRVRVVRFAPLGDPMDIEVRGYHLSLRKREAAQISLVS